MLSIKTKITVFGDSIGKGIVTDGGKLEVVQQSAVGLFEDKYQLKVDNRSSYGQSLKRIMQRGLIDKYIEELDTSVRNVAVLELGGNDADFNWKEVASSPSEPHFPKTPLKEFSALYAESVKKLKGAGVKVVACTIVPIDSKRFFNRVIGGITDKQKVLDFFKGDFNTIHRHQEMFNNEILKNAYMAGLSVIDLRREFLDSIEFENLMCQVGIHPNQNGHSRMFGAIDEFLITA